MVKARTLWPGVESPPAPTGQGAEHPVYPCQSNCISSPDCHLLNDPSNNPFEEQLDAPTALVDGRDDQCCQGEIVGQESQRFAGLGIDKADTSEPLRVLPFALGHSQSDDSVAAQACGSVDGGGFASRIGVGTTHWIAPPLPPNRTCGSPASGSPVSTLLLSGDSSLFPGLF